MSRSGKGKRSRYVVLGLLAAVAGYHTRYHTLLSAIEVKRTWGDADGYALPFRLKAGSREVETVEGAAGEVVKPGDRIEAIDGRRVEGLLSITRRRRRRGAPRCSTRSTIHNRGKWCT